MNDNIHCNFRISCAYQLALKHIIYCELSSFADMNKTDNTKQVRHGILLLHEMFTLTQTGTTTIKLLKTSTSKQLLDN